MRKQVQIPIELFMDLLRFHCLGDESISEVRIQKALEEKLDALIRHEPRRAPVVLMGRQGCQNY